nr:multiple cyclophane-containing RiPP AmcA [Actinoplanes regularis]
MDPVTARVHDTRNGLATLIAEAEEARRQRAEEAPRDGGSAVCAWNHFENIPTFYNWNNRPR